MDEYEAVRGHARDLKFAIEIQNPAAAMEAAGRLIREFGGDVTIMDRTAPPEVVAYLVALMLANTR